MRPRAPRTPASDWYTNRWHKAPRYDGRGNLQSAASSTWYIYSAENMLTSAWNQATLSYDPLHRLFQISGATVVRQLYDGATLIAEYDNGNSLLRRYVHGPGVDEPLVWYEGTGTSDRRFYHADERGSIVATSNSSGAMLTVNSYDEYGIPGSGNTGRFQYAGQQWLAELGMHRRRWRSSPARSRSFRRAHFRRSWGWRPARRHHARRPRSAPATAAGPFHSQRVTSQT